MTIQSNTPELAVISDAAEEQIISAFRTLHTVVSLYGSKPLPSFDDMVGDSAQRDRIASRANRAMSALSAHRREATVAKFRAAVADIVAPYVQEATTARATFLSLPKEVRSFMPSFPSSVSVPLTAVAEVFPGVAEAVQVKYLHTLGYKVSKKDNAYHIVAELSSK
jgi:hypothetical protein